MLYLVKQLPIFSKNLKKLRKQKKLTAAKLAQKLNISHAALASWETGRHLPHLDDLIRIADFFEVSVDELLGRPSIPKLSIPIQDHDINLFFQEVHSLLKENSELSERDLDDLSLIFEIIQIRQKKEK